MKDNWGVKFHEYYLKEYETLLQAALRMTGSKEDAEDLVNETFLTALSRREEFSACPNPEGWLMKTLHYKIQNMRRRGDAQTLPLENAELIPAPASQDDLEDILPQGLPQEDRDILIWKYRDQLKQREIADRLGVSVSVAANRISRALLRCRTLLGIKAKDNKPPDT